METTTCYRPACDTVLRHVAGEALLIPVHGRLANLQRLYVLDPVAEHVWAHLDGRHDVAALRDLIAARWSVSPAEAEADLRAFLAELAATGLIAEA